MGQQDSAVRIQMNDRPTHNLNASEEFLYPSWKKGSILTIDDDPNVLEAISGILEESGYEVHRTLEGQAAVEIAKATAPDLILLDIMLSGISGYDVCRNLKAIEETCEIPVIFLSALGQSLDKVKAFQAGGADYITKPFNLDETLARVAHQITIRRQQKQLLHQNQQLQQEIEERKQAQAALQRSNQELQQEIHQRQQAEANLRESQEKLQGILDIAGEAIISMNENCQIEIFNQSAESMFGYTAAEILGQPLDILFPNALRHLYQQHIRDFALSGHIVSQLGEQRGILGRRHNGEEFSAEASISRLRRRNETVFTVMMKDITERKKNAKALQLAYEELENRVEQRTAQLQQTNERLRREVRERMRSEEALQQSERRYATLAEMAPVGIFRVDIQGECIYINERCCQMMGTTPAEAFGSGWMSRIHSDDRKKVFRRWQRTLNTQIPFRLEHRFQRLDGTIIWVFAQATPETDDRGDAIGYIGTITDITDRKLAEEALKTLNQHLEELVEQRTNALTDLNQDLQQEIEERKRFEEALREARERLDSILASIDDVVWSLDAETSQVLYLNPAVEKIYHRPVADFVANRSLWLEVAHADDREAILADRQTFLETGHQEFEYRILRPDGEVRWIRVRAYLIYDSTGMPLRMDGITTDITERKQVEEALRASENKYRSLVENLSDGIYLFSADLQSVYANPGIESIFARPKMEVMHHLPESLLNCIHPDDRQRVFETFFGNSPQSGWVEAHYRVLTPAGETRYLRDRMQVIRDEGGIVRAYQGIVSDLSISKQTEIALKQAKEAADAGSRAKSEFLANMSHEIRTPINAILGFCDLLQGMICEPRSCSYLEAIATSGRALLELIEDILDLSKIEAGRLELHSEAIDLRRLLQEVYQIFSQKATQKKLSLLTEIDSTVPDGIRSDEVRLRQILFNVVGNALKFTEQGTVSISVRCWRADEKEAEGRRDREKAEGIEKRQKQEGRGQKGEGGAVMSIQNPMRKETGKGKEGRGLGSESKMQNPNSKINLELVVSDTGIGIAPDQQERIFEPFIQSEGQSSRRYGGTGLGLAITRRLTDMLGGQLSLSSKLGRGSCFTFVFPVVAIANPQTTPEVELGSDEDLDRFQAATILAVDDVQSNLDLIQEYFAGSKHRILTANDGAAALNIVRVDPPDLILLDLRMPYMGGEAVVQHLRQNEQTKEIPIVILTASSFNLGRQPLRHLCQGFLHKPISRAQLVAELRKILPQEQLERTTHQAEKDLATQPETGQWVRKKLPELLVILHREETTIWQELQQTMKMRDLQQFANQLQQWGIEYQCSRLLNYAKGLIHQIEAFDWDALPQTIAAFPEIVRSLETLSHESFKSVE